MSRPQWPDSPNWLSDDPGPIHTALGLFGSFEVTGVDSVSSGVATNRSFLVRVDPHVCSSLFHDRVRATHCPA
jgi:hypothetical protein